MKSPTLAIPSGPAPLGNFGTPFRHILCAIDFSEASLGALSEALALAQQSGGHLRLLHVLDGFPYETVYSGSRVFSLMHEFRARVARVNRELRSLIPPDALNWSQIEVATVSGQAHASIVAAASERRTDLVVLGLPRRSRLEQVVARVDGAESPSSYDVACASCARSVDGKAVQTRGGTRCSVVKSLVRVRLRAAVDAAGAVEGRTTWP